VVCPLQATHETCGVRVEGFLLLRVQCGIQGFGGVGTLLHPCFAFGVQRLHAVDALRRAHFFPAGAVEPGRRLGQRLHGLRKAVPGGFLRGLQLQLALQIGQVLLLARLAFLLAVFARVVHALCRLGRVIRAGGAAHAARPHLRQCCAGRTGQCGRQGPSDPGGVTCFHRVLLCNKAPGKGLQACAQCAPHMSSRHSPRAEFCKAL